MNKANETPPAPEVWTGALTFPAKVVHAFKPGDVVFIEAAKPMRVEAMQHIHAEFKRLLPGLRVVILQDGLKVVGNPDGPTCSAHGKLNDPDCPICAQVRAP